MSSAIRVFLLKFLLDNKLRKLLFNPEQIFGNYVNKGNVVADIGCGPGFFTIPLADLVGQEGHVIAVDIEQNMIDRIMRNAKAHGLEKRIIPHKCLPEALNLTEPLDFALCFWTVHEVPDQENFLHEIFRILKDNAFLLIAEPKAHVLKNKFLETLQVAEKIGFRIVSRPKIRASYAALFAAAK